MVHPRFRIFLNLITLTRWFGGGKPAAPAGHGFSKDPPPSRTTAAALAVFVLAACPIIAAARTLSVDGIVPAQGPVDHHRAGHGRSWDLLQAAADHVPVGSSFTVRAPTPLKEMHLYMMALGQLRGRRACPSSYFNHPQPHMGFKARYVLVLAPMEPPAEPDLQLVASTRLGSIFYRGER